MRAYGSFGRWKSAVVPLAVLVLLADVAPALSQVCTGDCDGDGAVTVDELVTGVNVALGAAGIDSCRAFDADGGGAVTVDEIVTAVNHALRGCPATPTPTETATETPTQTATDTPAGRCLINNIIEPGEECDDGVNRPFVDGCSAQCTVDCGCVCTTIGQRSFCSCDLGIVAAVNELDSSISITTTDPRCAGLGGGGGTMEPEAVPVAGIPRDLDVSPDGRFAFITTQSPDQIVVIDLASRRIERIIDRNIGAQPEAVACSPRGDALFVTSIAEGTVTMLDPRTEQLLGEFFVGDVPNDVDVAMTQDGVFAYVTNAILEGGLTIVDADNLTARSIDLGIQADIPSSIECSPDGRYAFVTNFFSHNVSILDTSTNELVRPFPLNINILQNQGIDLFPTDVAFSPDGGLAYVTAFGSRAGSDAIVVIDTALAVGDNPLLAVDPERLIFVDEFPTNIAIGQIRHGDGTVESNGTAYVTNFVRDASGFPTRGSIALVDLTDKTIQNRIPIGKFGLRVAIAPPRLPEGTPAPTPAATPPLNCGRVNCPLDKFCCVDTRCHQLGCIPDDKCVDSEAQCAERPS